MANIDDLRVFWSGEVLPLVKKCAPGYRLLLQIENTSDESEQEKLLEEYEKEHGKRELVSVFYIGQMAGKVERALFKERDPRIFALQAYGALNSEDFYKDLFKNEETEEVKNYRALGKKLEEFISLM